MVALECKTCAALLIAQVQPAKPATIKLCFPQRLEPGRKALSCTALCTPGPRGLNLDLNFQTPGGALEGNTKVVLWWKGGFVLQRKFEWMELPVVLARAASPEWSWRYAFRVSFLLGRYGNFHPIQASVRGTWRMAVRRSAPLGSVYFLIPRGFGSTPPVDGATLTCALGEGSEMFVDPKIIPRPPPSVGVGGVGSKQQ